MGKFFDFCSINNFNKNNKIASKVEESIKKEDNKEKILSKDENTIKENKSILIKKSLEEGSCIILEKIYNKINEIYSLQKKQYLNIKEESKKVSCNFLQQVFPDYVEKYGCKDLEVFLEKTIDKHVLQNKQKIKIFLHKDSLNFLKKKLQNENIEFFEKQQCEKADCEITWEYGKVCKYPSKIIEEI